MLILYKIKVYGICDYHILKFNLSYNTSIFYSQIYPVYYNHLRIKNDS